MAKRYLGGGVSFEQKDVYQEFSEDGGGGGGGSSTLSGLTDVDISNPTNGQTLVYDAASQKWVNGGALIVNITVHDAYEPTEYAIMDKTAGEIMGAINAGIPVIFRQTETSGNQTGIYFGALSYMETVEVDSVPRYSFSLHKIADAGEFYRGTYRCIGADAYPQTMSGGE